MLLDTKKIISSKKRKKSTRIAYSWYRITKKRKTHYNSSRISYKLRKKSRIIHWIRKKFANYVSYYHRVTIKQFCVKLKSWEKSKFRRYVLRNFLWLLIKLNSFFKGKPPPAAVQVHRQIRLQSLRMSLVLHLNHQYWAERKKDRKKKRHYRLWAKEWRSWKVTLWKKVKFSSVVHRWIEFLFLTYRTSCKGFPALVQPVATYNPNLIQYGLQGKEVKEYTWIRSTCYWVVYWMYLIL